MGAYLSTYAHLNQYMAPADKCINKQIQIIVRLHLEKDEGPLMPALGVLAMKHCYSVLLVKSEMVEQQLACIGAHSQDFCAYGCPSCGS